MNSKIALPFRRRTKIVMVGLLLCCVAFVPARQAQKKPSPAKKASKSVDDKALRLADARAGEWLTHGRDYSETRYSPLKQIDASNAQKLGLAWSFDTQTNRGLEA